MASGSTGVVASAGTSGQIVDEADQRAAEYATGAARGPCGCETGHGHTGQTGGTGAMAGSPLSGRGAQFIYVAATVANILCDNLTQTQINLLANFLSVVTTCVYAVLTVENPTDLLEQ